ncbi:MAG: RAMP superfamily CRISPR-associated protein [Dethiobacteria bacterium]|jgi:CRISPR/Cas system CSM-associated protein Csm3 (group 7 of RAMP superfamily)
MTKNNASIKGKFLIEGTLSLLSPLIIGTGEKQDLDIVVIKDKDGNPYIPSTSLTGVLRHYFYERLLLAEDDRNQFDFFWGSPKNSSFLSDSCYQSAFIIEDLIATNTPFVTFRDGVCISPYTGTARDEMKFDYEVVEPETDFEFKAQVTLRESFCRHTFLKIIATIIKILTESKVSLGAMTTKGFGECYLKNYAIYEYNFTKKRDVFAWLKREITDEQKIALPFNETFPETDKNLSLEAVFKIKNSLIVKSYSGNPKNPDAVHIKSKGKNIIPGASIKGALRSRAVKIINTMGGAGEEMTKKLFGWAPSKPDGKEEKIKSRFLVKETYIDNTIEEIQFRTRIDRFTGGVINSALFDTQPLWPQKKKDEQVKINIEIRNYKDWEVGLTLLLLKDLWNGDLPLGGDKSIGRGVLQGLRARINMGKKKSFEIHHNIENKQQPLKINNQDDLEIFVQSFLKECQQGVNNN